MANAILAAFDLACAFTKLPCFPSPSKYRVAPAPAIATLTPSPTMLGQKLEDRVDVMATTASASRHSSRIPPAETPVNLTSTHELVRQEFAKRVTHITAATNGALPSDFAALVVEYEVSFPQLRVACDLTKQVWFQQFAKTPWDYLALPQIDETRQSPHDVVNAIRQKGFWPPSDMVDANNTPHICMWHPNTGHLSIQIHTRKLKQLVSLVRYVIYPDFSAADKKPPGEFIYRLVITEEVRSTPKEGGEVRYQKRPGERPYTAKRLAEYFQSQLTYSPAENSALGWYIRNRVTPHHQQALSGPIFLFGE